MIFYSDAQRHLICVPYSVENLHRMAAQLGLKRCWFHAHRRHPHYDIPKQRVAEIAARTTVITPRALLQLCEALP